MSALRCYSELDLQPFHGLVQVVENHEARALSLDGVHWRLQLLWEWREPGWGLLDTGRLQRRWLDAADWSEQAGLRHAALPPEVDREDFEALNAALLQALLERLAGLPFPRRDLEELWLCSDDGVPLALLASAATGEGLPVHAPLWLPLRETRLSEGEERAVEPPRELLERLYAAVERRARRRRTRRLRRDASGLTCAEDGVVETPELLLASRWDDPELDAAVACYHAWQAPWLLQLPHLSDATRLTLEREACKRPWLVDALHRSWPRRLDDDALTAARVEARLRHRR